jgi:maleylacetate reductase
MTGAFGYINPPLIRWGAGSIGELAADLDRLGARNLGLVTTRSVKANSELMAAVVKALGAKPAATVVIGQHAPTADVDHAVEAAAGAGADAIVSVGGGSPIDAAKIVALRVGEQRSGGAPLPHIAVPTTLSAAELSAGAGITTEAGDKSGLRDPGLLPSEVIYDADLTLLTPVELWLSTGIRAVDHAVEGFLADGEHPFSDTLALDALRRLIRGLPEAKARPGDLDVRTDNQLGAWFSMTLPDWSAIGLSHMMGKAIGARHGIPHGVTSCLLLPHAMRYRATQQPDRMVELARGIGAGDEVDSAADLVFGLIRDLGLPQHIADYGIGEPELRVAAEAQGGRHQADDLLAVYMAAI